MSFNVWRKKMSREADLLNTVWTLVNPSLKRTVSPALFTVCESVSSTWESCSNSNSGFEVSRTSVILLSLSNSSSEIQRRRFASRGWNPSFSSEKVYSWFFFPSLPPFSEGFLRDDGLRPPWRSAVALSALGITQIAVYESYLGNRHRNAEGFIASDMLTAGISGWQSPKLKFITPSLSHSIIWTLDSSRQILTEDIIIR